MESNRKAGARRGRVAAARPDRLRKPVPRTQVLQVLLVRRIQPHPLPPPLWSPVGVAAALDEEDAAVVRQLHRQEDSSQLRNLAAEPLQLLVRG